MTPSNDSHALGPSRERLGPSLSLLGVSLWVATISAYAVLMRGAPEAPGNDGMGRLLATFIVAALGVFAASIVSGVGLFLSATERKRSGDGRGPTRRGVVLGWIGVGLVGLVVLEILRLSLAA